SPWWVGLPKTAPSAHPCAAWAFSGQTPPHYSQHQNSQTSDTTLNVTRPEAHHESPRPPTTAVTSEYHAPAGGWSSRRSRTYRRSPPSEPVTERNPRNPSACSAYSHSSGRCPDETGPLPGPAAYG